MLAGLEVSKNRYKFEDAYFSVPLLREEDTIQLQIRADLLLLANKPLKAICSPELTKETTLPNIEPLKYTISLTEENLYKLENIFRKLFSTFLPILGLVIEKYLKSNIDDKKMELFCLAVNGNPNMNRVHTAFIHYNETEVKNLHDSVVTEDQTVSRSLMKAFAITAAQARQLYGVSI